MRVLFLLAVAAGAGCGGASRPVPSPPNTPAPAAVSVGPPVSVTEAERFAGELRAAMTGGDATAIGRCLRFREMLTRSADGLGFTATELAQVLRGEEKAMDAFAASLAQFLQAGGRYDLLRLSTRNGGPWLLFRMLGGDGGVNYHELPLIRYPDGVGPADLHNTFSGEPFSVTYRRTLTRLAADNPRGPGAGLSDAERVYLNNMPAVMALRDHLREGRYAEALASYHSLPALLQSDKMILLLAVRSANGAADDAESVRLVGLFRGQFPDDPAINLLSIDYHFLRKQSDEMLIDLDRLDKQVGGDPYLNLLRSTAHAQAGRPKDAQAAAERLVAKLPTEPWGYQAGAAAAVTARDHPRTLTWYKRWVEAGAVAPDPGFIRGDDEYAAFRLSPQFAELETWLAARPGPADLKD